MQSAILTNCGETAGSLVSPSPDFEVRLTGDDLFKLSGDARGTQIASAGGSLWVTQKGDEKDYMLRTGEKMQISCKGMVIVQSFSDARVRITPATR